MKIGKYTKLFGAGPLGAFISIGLLIFFWWVNQVLGQPKVFADSLSLKVIAGLLVAIGIGLHLWTFKTLQAWWEKDQLCTTGPFRYFRHPMYAAWITFVCLGAGLYLNSWVYLIWYVLLQRIWHWLVIKEEILMNDIFGSEYLRYAEHTGRFIPRQFWKLHKFRDSRNT